MSKPFLKWAGGKSKLVPLIESYFPKASRKRLIEPFSGSGSVTLGIEFESYLLADANLDLINLFEALKIEKEDFIDYCESFFTTKNNESTRFYELRERFNYSQNKLERAALFLYLNRHAYNGLCRYNSKGIFNVPFGRYKRIYFPKNEMFSFIRKSERIELRHSDFEESILDAQPDDLIYCDPPYATLNQTSSFSAYTSNGFSDNDQERLANLVISMCKETKGIIVSNHDTELIRSLYQGARIKTIQVQRNISSKGFNRKKVNEILAIFE